MSFGKVFKSFLLFLLLRFLTFDCLKIESLSRHFQGKFENTKCNKQVFWDFFVPFSFFKLGVCPTGLGMFPVTEAGHSNLCGIVGFLRGEKPPLREVGPPEQSQCDLRRPLASPDRLRRLEKNQGRRKPTFSGLMHIRARDNEEHKFRNRMI